MDMAFGRAVDILLVVLALGAAAYYFIQGQTRSAVLFLGAAVLFTAYDLIRRYLDDLTDGEPTDVE